MEYALSPPPPLQPTAQPLACSGVASVVVATLAVAGRLGLQLHFSCDNEGSNFGPLDVKPHSRNKSTGTTTISFTLH